MIQAVLFDMDSTLLDLNLTAFMSTYVADVSRILAQITGDSPARFGLPFVRGYLALARADRADGLTNAELFGRTFERLSGVPIDDPAILDAISCYERDVLPQRNTKLVGARPMEGGLAALDQVTSMGLRCALATNPSFSGDCIRARMGWAGLLDAPFERISDMENSTRLKPNARYYEEFIASLGLRPDECLMVGNDAKRDFPRPDIGLRTIYVGHARPRRAVWSGRMSELAEALPALIDRINLEDAR